MFTQNPVIDFMPDQRDMEDKGGTMRLGLSPARRNPGPTAPAVPGPGEDGRASGRGRGAETAQGIGKGSTGEGEAKRVDGGAKRKQADGYDNGEGAVR